MLGADIQVPSPPTETVSSVSWSPRANFLAGGAWDNTLRCWEVSPTGSSKLTLQTQFEAPVLCNTWHDDGSKIFSGGTDNKAFVWDLQQNKTQQVAQHDRPIKEVAWIAEKSVLLTASWDKTLRYWDLRQPTPALVVNLSERVYCMDVRYPLCVVGTADNQISIFNLDNPQSPFKTVASPLKLQTRCVSCFVDKTGFAVGSIEGRVGIQYIDDNAKNFAFKCHRDQNARQIFSVNAISFHPCGTFSTAGSDGCFHFWDKDSKQRLKQFSSINVPITSTKFNAEGNLFAYGHGYDWSQGCGSATKYANQNGIRVHVVQEAEIKPRKFTGTKKR